MADPPERHSPKLCDETLLTTPGTPPAQAEDLVLNHLHSENLENPKNFEIPENLENLESPENPEDPEDLENPEKPGGPEKPEGPEKSESPEHPQTLEIPQDSALLSPPPAEVKEMADNTGRSSREVSAAVSKTTSEAQEEEDQERAIEAQIAELRRKQEALRLRREEASKQAARNNVFDEQSAQRRVAYQSLMGDDEAHVALAVRRSDRYEEHVDYLKGVAAEKDKAHDFMPLMALLYEQFFGMKSEHLVDIALRIMTSDPVVHDQAINDYKDSWSQHKGSKTTTERLTESHVLTEATRNDKADMPTEVYQNKATPAPPETPKATTQQRSTGQTPAGTGLTREEVPRATIEREAFTTSTPTYRKALAVVQQGNQHPRERSETQDTSLSSNSSVEMPKTKENPKAVMSPPAKTPTRGRNTTTATPSKKRARKDKSADSAVSVASSPPKKKAKKDKEEAPTSTIATPSPTKKAKKTKDGNELTALVKRFVERIEKRASQGNPVTRDLICSKCERSAAEPRVSTCLHLYCNGCLAGMCKESGATNGKNRAGVACSRSPCGKTLGRPGVVPIDVVQELRRKYIDAKIREAVADGDEEGEGRGDEDGGSADDDGEKDGDDEKSGRGENGADDA